MMARMKTSMCCLSFGLVLCMISHGPVLVSSGRGPSNYTTPASTSTPSDKRSFTFEEPSLTLRMKNRGKVEQKKDVIPDHDAVVFPSEEDEHNLLPLRFGNHAGADFKACSEDMAKTTCNEVKNYPKKSMEEALKTFGKQFQANIDVDGSTVLVPKKRKKPPLVPWTSQGTVVFPLEPDISPKISTKTFSTKSGLYPDEPAKEVLVFTTDKIDPIGDNSSITNRIGGGQDEYLCQSSVQVMFPQAGENRDGQWKYIVNIEEKFKQGVRAELCTERYSHRPCKHSDSFPPNLITRCQQKYIYRRLVAFENDTFFNDNFKIPSCCICVVTVKPDSSERRSGDVEPLPLSLSMRSAVADEGGEEMN